LFIWLDVTSQAEQLVGLFVAFSLINVYSHARLKKVTKV